MNQPPELSVVIASPSTIEDLKQILDSLGRQKQNGAVEIIVADCSQDGSADRLTANYPDVTFLHYAEGTPLPTLWGGGIMRSSGRIIAITDSTCVVAANWISAMLKSHQSQRPVIGGAIEPARLKKLLDWAAYFCEYGQFMHPLKSGAVNELPGNNISFKRPALERGREFVSDGFWKTYWCRRLQSEGIALISDPSIVVSYRKSYNLLPFLIRRYHHGKCFAGMRVAQVPLVMRLAYLAGSFLLPVLFLARVAGAILPKRRFLKEFILSLPFSALAVVIWSVGEFCGYLTGAGKSCDHVR
jgi:glycosyltransferase involved in cell wall biosynthesis